MLLELDNTVVAAAVCSGLSEDVLIMPLLRTLQFFAGHFGCNIPTRRHSKNPTQSAVAKDAPVPDLRARPQRTANVPTEVSSAAARARLTPHRVCLHAFKALNPAVQDLRPRSEWLSGS